MASSLSPSVPTIFSDLKFKLHYRSHRLHLSFFPKKLPSLFIARSADNGAGAAGSAVVEEKVEMTNLPEEEKSVEVKDKGEDSLSSNGVAVANAEVLTFKDPRWLGGTWDLMQFQKSGQTDWDAVIDA
ncbi:light-harvesting complex-like protein 3 isotype 1, chloroplastic, partial [Phalaenopsis equestris]|uniref:light-harvesting complex-like protein 3 isotype 1, chloroplastic n=1 Tax=Phalaenopsis equestris TaxID=78828 RepID=UPI0009E65CE5